MRNAERERKEEEVEDDGKVGGEVRSEVEWEK